MEPETPDPEMCDEEGAGDCGTLPADIDILEDRPDSDGVPTLALED